MARAKTKKIAQRPQPPARTGKANDPASSEVERRWKEYWARRKQLEEAVEKVRLAAAALKSAQELEKTRRAEFDDIKRSLTTLLDVDPVAAPAREPIPLQRHLPEPASKQLV
jgi:hypothetical protein